MTRRFRWAELQIAELETKKNADELLNALKSVPQSLEESYRQILDKIPASDLSTVRDVLKIICVSTVPFDLETVANMVHIDFAGDVITMCTSSLVSEDMGKVQVAHFSVQEYLIITEKTRTSEHHEAQFTVLDGHKYLAEKTVDYLLSKTQHLNEKQAMEQFPLVYSSKYWYIHSQFLKENDALHPELQAKIDRLFSESIVYFNWVRVADTGGSHRDSQWTKELQDCEPPIHRASRLGLTRTVETLLDQGADPFVGYTEDAMYGRSESCFNVAGENGELDVLKLLLSKGFQVPWNVVVSLMEEIDHSKAGKEKLADVLRMIWDQGLFGGKSESMDTGAIVKPYIIDMAMGNRKSNVEMMEAFLSWRPEMSVPITTDVWRNAVCGLGRPGEMTRLVFEKSDGKVPSNLFDGYRVIHDIGGIAFLAAEHPTELPITEEVILALAGDSNKKTMETLLRARKKDIRVTDKVLSTASVNLEGADMIRFLWSHREPEAKITQSMLPQAAFVKHHLEIMDFLLEKLGPETKLDQSIFLAVISRARDGVATLDLFFSRLPCGFSVSEELISLICKEKSDAVAMLNLLKSKGYFDMPITADLLSHAASNREVGPSVFSFLVGLHNAPPPITEKVLVAIVRNNRTGAKLLETVMSDIPDTLLTDLVIEEACRNRDALVMLLDRRSKDLPIQSMLGVIKGIASDASPILQILLERDLLIVDESLIETLVTDYSCLEVLLSWKPNVSITHEALKRATSSVASMRALMASKGNDLPIPEDIVMVAVTKSEAKEVIELIRNRQGPDCITERVMLEAIKDADEDILPWLLQQVPESTVIKLWGDTWQDINTPANSRLRLLLAYLERTGLKLTDAMLEDYPYDGADKNNYDLDETVEVFCTADFLPDVSDTERTAEIVLERCGNKTIQVFLESKPQLQITDSMLQAAGMNVIADKDELMSLLRERRG